MRGASPAAPAARRADAALVAARVIGGALVLAGAAMLIGYVFRSRWPLAGAVLTAAVTVSVGSAPPRLNQRMHPLALAFVVAAFNNLVLHVVGFTLVESLLAALVLSAGLLFCGDGRPGRCFAGRQDRSDGRRRCSLRSASPPASAPPSAWPGPCCAASGARPAT